MSTLAPFPRPDRLFFTTLLGLACLVSFAGFAPTYYLKHWFASPPLEWLVHVHAALFTAWLALLLTQSLLIRKRRYSWHASLGRWGLVIVSLMVISGFLVILGKPRPTEASRAFIFTPLLSLILFPAFVTTAIWLRRDAATHKRLMLLATLLFLGAPLTRLMLMMGIKPGPYLHHVLVYVLLLVPLLIHDWRSLGRLHPATMWATVALLLRHPIHEWVAHTPTWQRIAASITGS